MITSPEKSLANAQLREALGRASTLLKPKLEALLNPNLVDTSIRLRLSVQNEAVTCIHDSDTQPGYASALYQHQPDPEHVQSVLVSCLKTLKSRLEDKLRSNWHGTILLLVSICNGQATISSEADGVMRLDGK